jgi:O-acetylhomoserine/O-acetylserine sulfhydrylase-like pyridoxal-dependent enzyme
MNGNHRHVVPPGRGLEDVDDIISDLANAFSKAKIK